MIKERLDKHEKQIGAIRDLVKSGMQMVIATREDIRETRKDLRELRKDLALLAVSQRKTDASLQALIDQPAAARRKRACKKKNRFVVMRLAY